MIITEELIYRAIDLVRPSAEFILNSAGTTWGPRWVVGLVSAPGLREISFHFGDMSNWTPEWGKERDFEKIAIMKLQLAKRMGDDTSIIVSLCPWQLQEGEYLYSGGVSRYGVSAACSGAKGRTDEALADILVSTILMFAHLETDRRIQAEQMQI